MEDADALSLIAEIQWKQIGIELPSKLQTRQNFRLRTFSARSSMTAYAGIPTHGSALMAHTSPEEFAPTTQGGLQWSRWGMYIESKGNKQGR